jgi:hypothetical protein
METQADKGCRDAVQVLGDPDLEQKVLKAVGRAMVVALRLSSMKTAWVQYKIVASAPQIARLVAREAAGRAASRR